MSFGRDPPRRNGNPTGTLKRLTTEARLSKLPADHFRVNVRPRDGIGVKKIDKMTFMKATAMATGVSYEQGKLDMLCPNNGQNFYTISTQRMENAKFVCAAEATADWGKDFRSSGISGRPGKYMQSSRARIRPTAHGRRRRENVREREEPHHIGCEKNHELEDGCPALQWNEGATICIDRQMPSVVLAIP
ncbi:hypothetical protein HPB48_009393 [Haemaphysalis longicornis]|uniref:Uncharacterized protein n=1 Tax=Haemaphysalis longicornis TaxID=44386 RepID=A0A9J6GW02_HAELO|nr:hypothetical protein HPB48_009393 [Haemaphysalis longicornis]